MNILLVEDNKEINSILTEMLKVDGYSVTSCFNAIDALTAFAKDDFFCVITDLMMPVMSGEELIKKIRTDYYGLIIAVTAKTRLDDKLNVLSLGADDYIVKPFNKDEILLKIRNYYSKLIKSNHKVSLNKGELVFNFHDNQLLIAGQIVTLTSVEYLIVKYFINNLNRIVSRDDIMREVYYDDLDVFDRAIDGHIKNIRKKISAIVSTEYILTVYGLGYKLVGQIYE